MLLENCSVRFNNFESNDNIVFNGGDSVDGVVTLVLNETHKIKDLTLTAKGVSKCRWRTTGYGSGNGITFSNRTEEFSKTIKLIGKSLRTSGGYVLLEAGSYEFFFSFTIPKDVPTSLETKYGRVRYTVKISASHYKNSALDDHHIVPFTVISKCNLNSHDNCAEPVSKKVYKVFSSLFTNKGALQMLVNLPMTGFVPGQDIPITCSIKNRSLVNIDNVIFRFYQLTTYKSVFPYKSKKEDQTILKEYTGRGVDRGQDIDYPVNIRVPALPPSRTDLNSSIYTQYFLKVKSVASGSHSNASASIPITIGNVPLFKSLYQADSEGSSRSIQINNRISNYPVEDEAPPPYHDLILPTYEKSEATYRMIEADPEDTEDNFDFSPVYPIMNFPSPDKFNMF